MAIKKMTCDLAGGHFKKLAAKMYISVSIPAPNPLRIEIF